jgi:hypothetical protein
LCSSRCPDTTWTYLLLGLAMSSLRFGSQFSTFYPFYSNSLTLHDSAPCHANYSIKSFPQDTLLYGNGGPCKAMVTCLLSALGADNLADMASANIILGLTPTILGYIGPTLSESAQLFSRRPVLALLCTLGAPAVYQVRPFGSRTSPLDVPAVPATPELRKHVSRHWVIIIGVMQYSLVCAACLNVLTNSITLGVRTVISWKCEWQGLELAWVFLSLVAHIISAFSLHLSQVFKSIPTISFRMFNTFSSALRYLQRDQVAVLSRSYLHHDLMPAFSSSFTGK